MEKALNKIVPASWNHDGTFQHTDEGDDDMPGHIKSSMFGVSLNIPIKNGRLALGTWQVSLFLCFSLPPFLRRGRSGPESLHQAREQLSREWPSSYWPVPRPMDSPTLSAPCGRSRFDSALRVGVGVRAIDD